MDCRQIDGILDDHAASTLSTAEKAEVAAHLEQCPRCADAWFAAELLAADSPEPPRAGFYEATLTVAADTSVDEAPPPSAGRFGSAVGLAAAALLVIVIAGLIRSGDGGVATDPVGDDAVTARDRSDGSSSRAVSADTPRSTPAVRGLIAGVHYERLPTPVPTSTDADRVELCEFFMFRCVHCYGFEPELAAFVAARADEVELVRVPVLFDDLARLHAQAYYTAEVLGRRDALITPFFEEIHERDNTLASVAAIRVFFVEHGIAGRRFDEAFDSAEVRARLARAAELNRLYRVNVAPSIGVNGRYLTSPSMAGSPEAMLEVVDALLEADAPSCDGDDSARCRLQRVPPP